MNTEQVNVQELQRLNEAITLTIDAIRRTAPQLTQLQQQVMLSGVPMHPLFGAATHQGVPGIGFGVDPLTAAYLHAQSMMRGVSPFSPTPGFGMPGMSPISQFSPIPQLSPFGFGSSFPSTFGGVPQPWQQPWSQPYGYGQRVF